MNYTVAVRALCEFTAKQGDLDLRFTPSPSAQEGINGHAVVAARSVDRAVRVERLPDGGPPDLVARLAAGQTASGVCIHCNRCMPTIYSGTRCPVRDALPT